MDEVESYRRYTYLDIYGPRRRAWSGARVGWSRERPSRSRLREASEVSRVLRGAQLMRLVEPPPEEVELEGLCFFGSDPPHINLAEFCKLLDEYATLEGGSSNGR